MEPDAGCGHLIVDSSVTSAGSPRGYQSLEPQGQSPTPEVRMSIESIVRGESAWRSVCSPKKLTPTLHDLRRMAV
jgi:hypothetical protein